MWIQRSFALALFVFLVDGVSAQTAKPKDKAKRTIQLLAVGDPPPFKQVIENGVRREVPPPPGSLPPPEVSVSVAVKEGEEDKEFMAGATRLQLGRMSSPVSIPEGPISMMLREGRDAQAGKPWLDLKAPPTGSFKAVLWRRSRNVTWDDASALVMPVNEPAGTVRIFNATPATIAVILGTEKFALESRKSVRRPLTGGTPLGFHYALANNEGKLVRQASMSLEQLPSDRSLVVIYVADSPSSRKPLNVAIHREVAPAP